MRTVFLKVFAIPLAGLLTYALIRPKLMPHCLIPAELSEVINYNFEHVTVKDLPILNFSMKGEIIKARVKKISKSAEKSRERARKIMENLKVSLIKGNKNYLLIGPYFIEEGKEVNGIKFLKADKNYVYIKIGDEIFKKKY